jgi:hypothetical protein
MVRRRIKADWDDWGFWTDPSTDYGELKVEVDDDPRPSGLLNKDGHPLVRHRRPVGFLTFDTED